jgi:aerobic carbon-monoxide dehydrogenase large subunit
MNPGTPWIGRAVPRREAHRLASGKGRYTDDIAVAGVAHVAFLRSPYAHARIASISLGAARAAPGVIAIVTGDDLSHVCKP